MKFSEQILTDQVERVYYSVGDVAERFGVAPSLVRYWLDYFGLDVRRNQKGNRKFTRQDVDTVGKIYELVKIKRFTLEGAKMQLSERFREVNQMRQ